MRFGACSGHQNAQVAAKIGYDYLEGNLSNIAKMEPAALQEVKATMAAAGLQFEICNCFFPGSVKLTGEEANLHTIRDYVRLAFSKACELGLKTAVLGSGGAREVPPGFERTRAQAQLEEAFVAAGDIAREFGVMIALEPLSRADCNILHDVAEGDEIAARLQHRNIRVLADIYHMYRNEEPYSVIPHMQVPLEHVHFCDPTARRYPKLTDAYDYSDFAAALREANYNKCMSIEAGCDDFAVDARDALAVMQSLFAW